MKVSELTGAELDYWAAKANGTEIVKTGICYVSRKGGGAWKPTVNWAVGGPIIEREGIKLKDGMFEKWHANLKTPYYKFGMEGPTALIAAMRAFVASVYGQTVDDSQAD